MSVSSIQGTELEPLEPWVQPDPLAVDPLDIWVPPDPLAAADPLLPTAAALIDRCGPRVLEEPKIYTVCRCLKAFMRMNVHTVFVSFSKTLYLVPSSNISYSVSKILYFVSSSKTSCFVSFSNIINLIGLYSSPQ